LAGSLRQSMFGRLAGYEDVNDADRLCATRRCAVRQLAEQAWTCPTIVGLDRAAEQQQLFG
jgi:hypothetical protein